MRKYLAELLGTFGLTLAVALSLTGVCPVPTPIIAALTLGLFVYSLGHLSGTHINPAITIGAWSLRRIGNADAAAYIIAQFAGAGLALLLAGQIAHPVILTAASSPLVLLGELIGTFFFAFGIAAVIYDKVPGSMSGVVIGGSLLLGIALAAPFSNGVLNPAVAFGIGSFSWAYVVGPLVGSVLGMQVFAALSEKSA